MARIKITGPDGRIAYVTPPPDATEDQIQAKINEVKSSWTNATPSSPPPLSAGETATDVAKSAGIGVVQGGLGLATLPGNIEALGRMGIDAGARALGAADPRLSENTVLPTYSDAKGAVEQFTGEFYQPKTTLGKYARTVGEFAPAAIGAAGLASGAARVLGPALASETAGQLTEGTAAEPWARMGGALVGARLPQPGAAPRAARDPQYAAAVNRLDQEGVNALTAAQRTQNTPMRWVEDATATVPGGGGRAVQLQEQAAEQFTRAALARAGVQADRATPEVLEPAFQRAGQEFQQFFGAQTLTPSNTVRTQIRDVVRDYESLTPQAQQIGLIRDVAREVSNNPVIAGAQYAGFRSNLRRAQRSYRDNPQAANAVGRLIDTLDRAMVRSAPRNQQRQILDQLQDMNERYRNLLAIEKAAGGAGEQTSRGLISPAQLKNAIKGQNSRNYTLGRSEMGNLARAGETVMKPLRSSGTAERTQAQQYLSLPGALVGGIGAGGVEGMLAGTVLPWALKASAARAVMSRPGQAAIQNERILNPAQMDRNALMYLAPVALQAEKERGLRGGSGPSYDDAERNRLLDFVPQR